MVRGEYESMKALYSVCREMVPEPIAYGTFRDNPNLHFFLCDFVEMDDDLPEIESFCEKVARLHRDSQEKCPKGLFGFHVITCNGKLPQYVTEQESWENFFIESLKHEFKLEEEAQGPCEEYEKLLPVLYEKVCPRLLRPLETGGHTIKPTLVHGDLWNGNVGVHADTGEPFIFDASSFWAHNEYELAIWRGERYTMRRPYVREYFRHFPCSPPKEDWDDRNLLYSVRADLHDSILYPTTPRFRDLVLISVRKLVEKFGQGYQGSEALRGSSRTQEEALSS